MPNRYNRCIGEIDIFTINNIIHIKGKKNEVIIKNIADKKQYSKKAIYIIKSNKKQYKVRGEEMSSLSLSPISIDLSNSDAFKIITYPSSSNSVIQIQKLQKDQTPIIRATVTSEINRTLDDFHQIGLITKYPIRLPYLGYFKIEIEAYDNNNRSYIYLSKSSSNILNKNLLESKNESRHYLSDVSQIYKFRIKIKYPEIQIGLLIGGDSIILHNDQITIQSIKIYPENDPHASSIPTNTNIEQKIKLSSEKNINKSMSSGKDFVIRKVVHKISELEEASKCILAGEYVILRSDDCRESQDHLYVKNSQCSSLEYVCGIGLARPNIIGQGLIQNEPGKIMPVYTSRKEAMENLRQKGPNNFYRPSVNQDYHWQSNRTKDEEKEEKYGIDGNIYLYLDGKGYVRWLKDE